MLARKPDIHAEDAPIIWSQIPEFAQYWNGASVVIPYVEHYLIAVANEVKTACGRKNPALSDELEVFIDQERTHSTYHLQFNKRMYDAGYEDLKPLIETIKAELRELREKRSLAFNIAYCAGFENAATFSSQYLFEGAADLFEGADARGADLFLWHVAEEFEHRSVCHEALQAVSGKYFMRMYGLIYSFWHINHCFNRAVDVIFKRHREAMTPAEQKDSIARHRALVRRQHAYVLPRVVQLLIPGFDPARLKTPERVTQALKFYESVSPTKERFGFRAG